MSHVLVSFADSVKPYCQAFPKNYRYAPGGQVTGR
jgi:hypothetical protein